MSPARNRTRSPALTDPGTDPAVPPRAVAKSLASATYVPTFLAEVGVGAMLPIFALSVLALEGSAVVASLAVAAYALGRVAGSAWGGKLSARIGPARASMVSLAFLTAGAAACAISPSVVPLVVSVLVVGVGHAAYHVARQAQINAVVASRYRARALTTLAGVWRIGNFVGPLVGAVIIAWQGLPWAYVFAAVMVAGGMVALRLAPAWRVAYVPHPQTLTSVRAVLAQSWPVIRTLGFAVMLTGGLRTARLVVIPLWASHIGLGDDVTSAIFAASAAVDMLLFYPAGAVMDRWGRKWTVIPSTLLLALGTALLPLTTGVVTVTAVALLLGIGNGWGSGSLMVLAADAAPANGRDTFTGVWMILQDSGGLVMPAVVSAGALIALPVGFFAVGAIGVGTSVGLHAWVPPWRPTGSSA